MSEITIICKRTVVSIKPVQPGKFHHLSVLDRIMKPDKHIQVVHYYKTPKNKKPGELTKKLRESIADMLCSFTALTGRLLKDDKGQWMIKCNDAGVRMVEARARGSMEEWLKEVDREKELKLVHWEEMYHKPYYWATFYVQVTEFDEGGLAIGLSCSHILCDPICATMFIKAWANTTLNRTMSNPPFFHPLPPRRSGNKIIDHHPYTTLIDHYKSSLSNPFPPATITKPNTAILAFTSDMVKSCMLMAKTTKLTASAPEVTPFEALAAFFWVCVSKVKGRRDDLTDMSLCLDMRKTLGLDKGFFGNCMVYNKVHGEGLGWKGVSEAANAIRQVVNKMDVEGAMDLIEWLDESEQQCLPYTSGDLIFTNLDATDSNLDTFEDHYRLIRASCYVQPEVGEGQVLILPSLPGEDKNSRLVMVTLPDDEVNMMCEDALLLPLNPTILMGPRNT